MWRCLWRGRQGSVTRAADELPGWERYPAVMRLILAARGPRPGWPSRWRPAWPRTRSARGETASRAGRCAVLPPARLRRLTPWSCRRRPVRPAPRCAVAAERRHHRLPRRRSLPITGRRSFLLSGGWALSLTHLRVFPLTRQLATGTGDAALPPAHAATAAPRPAGAPWPAQHAAPRATGPLLPKPGRGGTAGRAIPVTHGGGGTATMAE